MQTLQNMLQKSFNGDVGMHLAWNKRVPFSNNIKDVYLLPTYIQAKSYTYCASILDSIAKGTLLSLVPMICHTVHPYTIHSVV